MKLTVLYYLQGWFGLTNMYFQLLNAVPAWYELNLFIMIKTNFLFCILDLLCQRKLTFRAQVMGNKSL